MLGRQGTWAGEGTRATAPGGSWSWCLAGWILSPRPSRTANAVRLNDWDLACWGRGLCVDGLAPDSCELEMGKAPGEGAWTGGTRD